MTPSSTSPKITWRLLNLLGPFLGLLLVIGLFSISPTIRPYFLSGANFKIILTQTVIVATGTLGMTLIIVSGGIDLSVGSVVALASVVGAVLMQGHSHMVEGGNVVSDFWVFVATVAMVLTGAGVGFVNGLIIGRLKMMPFIVTLGMMGIARGAAKWLSRSQTVNAPESRLNRIMELVSPQTFLPLPYGVWIVIGLGIVMALVMRRMVFGCHVFAIGANEAAARLSGIRITLHKVAIYTIAGVFFGIAGLMQLSRLTQGEPTVAIGLELDIIAAVVIGGASLNGGSGSIFGSMIGALIMAVLRNGSTQMDWPTYVQEIIIGAVIILAVGVDRLRQHRRDAA